MLQVWMRCYKCGCSAKRADVVLEVTVVLQVRIWCYKWRCGASSVDVVLKGQMCC